jgi:hypothetical protein
MYLTATEGLKLASKAALLDRLNKDDADQISKAENGITFILEFLKYWEKQDAIHMFDWEYLAIKEWDFLEWVQQNQIWKWERIPNDRILKTWNEYDMKR